MIGFQTRTLPSVPYSAPHLNLYLNIFITIKIGFFIFYINYTVNNISIIQFTVYSTPFPELECSKYKNKVTTLESYSANQKTVEWISSLFYLLLEK